jgi:hypothetical protein
LPAVLGYVAPALPVNDASMLASCKCPPRSVRRVPRGSRTAYHRFWRVACEPFKGTRHKNAKVLQSISSVIEALPPEEQIAPVEVVVNSYCILLQRVINRKSRQLCNWWKRGCFRLYSRRRWYGFHVLEDTSSLIVS